MMMTQVLAPPLMYCGIAVVLLHALRGGGNDFDDKKVKSLIQETGIVASCSAVATMLVDSLNDPNSEDDESAKKN